MDVDEKVMESEAKEAVKERKCLMCGQEFSSEWAGDRICRRCKATEAWRRG